MGLFDSVYNSYKPLGEEFLNKELQTKDLECCMNKYWISPSGELFVIDDREAFEMTDNPKPEGFQGLWWSPFKWEPTGKNQKLRPVYFYGPATIYPSEWKGKWEDWPEATLLIRYGKIENFLINNKGERFNDYSKGNDRL